MERRVRELAVGMYAVHNDVSRAAFQVKRIDALHERLARAEFRPDLEARLAVAVGVESPFAISVGFRLGVIVDGHCALREKQNEGLRRGSVF
jgi:hypothetical protein